MTYFDLPSVFTIHFVVRLPSFNNGLFSGGAVQPDKTPINNRKVD